jgi:hypothetical protein
MVKRFSVLITVAAVAAVMLVATAAGPALAAKVAGSDCRDGATFVTTDQNAQRNGAVHGCGDGISTSGGKGNCGINDGTPFATEGEGSGVVHSCGYPIVVD